MVVEAERPDVVHEELRFFFAPSFGLHALFFERFFAYDEPPGHTEKIGIGELLPGRGVFPIIIEYLDTLFFVNAAIRRVDPERSPAMAGRSNPEGKK